MENNNNKAIYIFLAIAVVMFLTVGGTLAYLTWVTNSSQQTAVSFTTTAGLSCSADGGGNITSSDVKLAPATCTDSEHAIQRTITTNVTNSNEGSAYMSLSLKVNQMASELAASENFKYALTSNPSSCTTGVLKTGTFTGATENSTFTILEDEEYSSSPGTGTYYLYIWLDEAESNNNTQNKTFNLSLTGVCTNHISTIGDALSSSAVIDNTTSQFVTNSNGVQFSASSSDTNGKGLYIRAGTENDLYPIYYYRGAVTDNNVLFGGFCWKIVRTTNTGGTKLIYNGTPTGTNNNECNNTGTAAQLASTSAFNSNSNSLADVGYMYGTRYTYSSGTGTGWYYAPDVTYSNETYTLVSKDSYNVETKSTISGTNLNYHHYTCGSDTATTCASVRYVYYVSSSTAYYITLTNGKKVEDALDEMLTNSANTTNSTIKTAIDTWYAANMTSYTSKLEDTPYCNDRTIYQLGGWSPTGSTTSYYLYLGTSGRMNQSPYTPSLTCNTNDAFTTNASNGNGKLTYPVGLLTADEIRLGGGSNGGGNSTHYLYTGQSWWSTSPTEFYFNGAYGYSVAAGGNFIGYSISAARGVRPAVSLKLGTKFSSGDGSYTDPYVVE